MAFCSNCGKELTDGNGYFAECGALVSKEKTHIPSPVTETAASKKPSRVKWIILSSILFLAVVGGVCTMIFRPAREVFDADYPMKLDAVLYDLCYYSDEYDGTEYTDGAKPTNALSDIVPLLDEILKNYLGDADRKFITELKKACDPLSSLPDGYKGKLRDLGFDIETVITLFRNRNGMIPFIDDPDSKVTVTSSKASSKSSTVSSRSSASASPATLSGRWEGGQYAIVFRSGLAYLGSAYNNDTDIIAECTSWNKGICTYTITATSVTFKDKKSGRTATLKYDGKKITDSAGAMFDEGTVLYKE